jgi:hypothetical protein
MRILTLVGALLLVGCASTQTDYTWYKRFDPLQEDRQRQIDLAACVNTESDTAQRSEQEQFDAVGDSYVADQAHVTRVDACMMRRGWAKVRAS